MAPLIPDPEPILTATQRSFQATTRVPEVLVGVLRHTVDGSFNSRPCASTDCSLPEESPAEPSESVQGLKGSVGVQPSTSTCRSSQYSYAVVVIVIVAGPAGSSSLFQLGAAVSMLPLAQVLQRPIWLPHHWMSPCLGSSR
jgi:hypothetical protein